MGDDATTDTTAPLLFRKLLTLLDEMRRDCIRNVMSGGQYKRIQGLTVRQGSAVAQLHLLLQDEPAGIALKTLANRLQMSVPATSLLVESMVGKGLFERHENPDDRRAVRIRLSEKGMQLFQLVYGQFQAMLEEFSVQVAPEEMAALGSVVQKLEASRRG